MVMIKSTTELSEAYFEKFLTLSFSHLVRLPARPNPGNMKIYASATNVCVCVGKFSWTTQRGTEKKKKDELRG